MRSHWPCKALRFKASTKALSPVRFMGAFVKLKSHPKGAIAALTWALPSHCRAATFLPHL